MLKKYKKIFQIATIGAVIGVFIGAIISLVVINIVNSEVSHSGELDEIIDEAQSELDLEEIEYEKVLYFDPEMMNQSPFGEFTAEVILQLNEEQSDNLIKKIKENGYQKFSIPQKIESSEDEEIIKDEFSGFQEGFAICRIFDHKIIDLGANIGNISTAYEQISGHGNVRLIFDEKKQRLRIISDHW